MTVISEQKKAHFLAQTKRSKKFMEFGFKRIYQMWFLFLSQLFHSLVFVELMKMQRFFPHDCKIIVKSHSSVISFLNEFGKLNANVYCIVCQQIGTRLFC